MDRTGTGQSQSFGAKMRTVDLLASQALDVDDPPLAVHLHHLAVAALHEDARDDRRPQLIVC